MKKIKENAVAFAILIVGLYGLTLFAHIQTPLVDQAPPRTVEEKREQRKNMVVKEINTDAKGKRQWVDRVAVWNEAGLKLEDIEYAVYGQRERITYEYNEAGICIRENVYNDKNKLVRIRKYEYHPNGRKKIQYNYNPDGKLYTTKIFEYSFKDGLVNQ
ncbi:hypothetical protein LJB84_01080 [Bacteroidales bacterium OttesenSCG-928-J19]|nr:hypothetical protein [Bacteroidales bacterium OttesenSCG-928-J19]